MTSLCSGREKVRPVRSDVNANAKKFAQRGKNGLKVAVDGVLGEYFRARAQLDLVLGEYFRARAQMGLVWGEFFRARAQMDLVWGEFFRARGLICPDAAVLFRVTRTRTLSSVGVFNCLCIRLFV